LVAALAAIAAPQAQAQVTRFTGASVQAGIGYTSFHMGSSPVLVLVGNADNAETINSSGDGRATLHLGAGYNFAMNDRWTLGIGLDVNPLKLTEGVGTGAEADVKSKQDSSWTLSIQPGMVVDADSMVYGKVGYAEAKIKNSYGGALGESGALGTLNGNTYKGWTAGIGYKHFYNSNLYAFAEANYTKYGKERIIALGTFYADRDLKSYNATFGVGYRF
jgi:opacity protein-like surface antigen